MGWKPMQRGGYSIRVIDTSISDRIERALAEFEPGAKLLRTWPLAGGISAGMTAFEIERPGGETAKMIARRPSRYKFALDKDVAAVELQVLRTLKEAGLPVQAGYYVETGVEEPFFIIEYIEGKPEVGPANPEEFLQRFTDQLVAIHRVHLDHLPALPKQDYGFTPDREPEDQLREPEIRRALNAHGPITGPNQPVLRHGDYWPGNVLWRDGEIAGVIDWEEALVGEPLADLGICRLDIWWILGEEASNEFTRHYKEAMPLDYSELPYWDLCASLRPIRNIEEWAPAYTDLGRPDITAETLRRNHQEFVDRALSALRSAS